MKKLMMLGTMDLPRYVYIACMLLLVLVRFAHSANEIPYSCTFEDAGSCNLKLSTTKVTWMLGGQRTDTGSQGPTADHTWGTDNGEYVYSASKDEVKATPLAPSLTSADFHLSTGEGVLSFYYYLWGSNGNVLNVYTTCEDTRTLIWAYGLTDGSMDSWTRAEAPLACTSIFTIIFEGVHKTNNSYIAVDDITLHGTGIETDGSVFMKTPTTTDMMRDGTRSEPVTSDQPHVMMSTMPTGGVHNQPQETVTLSIILFLLALVFMIISVTVHCYIWQKRKKFGIKMRPKQMSVHNSGYDCPIHTNHRNELVINAGIKKASVSGHSDQTRIQDADKHSVKSLESGIVANGGVLSIIVPSILRGRSKTVPNKRSFEHYESIEMESDPKDDTSKEKRVLSDKGDKRKQGFLEKARHFTRSNSLPNCPGNDFYESIDHTRIRRGPVAYEVTDLLPDSFSTNTLVDDCRDNRSSNSSIPSMHSNHLKIPMTYDNLERKSPLLTLPTRHSHCSGNYTPPSLRLNLSGSQCNIESIYDTTSASQCDITSLSSYGTPTGYLDASPSRNPQSNPFFQSAQPSDTYNSLNRHPRTSPSTVINDGPPSTTTPLSTAASRPTAYQTPNLKSKEGAPQPNEYHTLDPDAISDASFERSASEDSEMLYECPQTKTLQQVKSESIHDYEDLD